MIKQKRMSRKWSWEHLTIIRAYFQSGMSFEEISDKFNEWLEERYETYPIRTPNAVAIQLLKSRLITQEDLNKWKKEYKIKEKRDRDKGRTIKQKVKERDNYRCRLCDSKENLEFAHIIPFRETRKYIFEEGLTLCKRCHTRFDKIKEKIVIKRVFEIMDNLYPNRFYIKKFPSLKHIEILEIKRIEK